MRYYTALIRKEKSTCYGVDFPDFPGCVTAAETVKEAQARAVEVLELHVDGMVEDGEPVPISTGIDQILEEDSDGFVMAVQIPLADKKSKTVRVDITIPKDLSLQVDRLVKSTEGVNRSSFFARAGMAELQRTLLPGFMVKSRRRSKAIDIRVHEHTRAGKSTEVRVTATKDGKREVSKGTKHVTAKRTTRKSI